MTELEQRMAYCLQEIRRLKDQVRALERERPEVRVKQAEAEKRGKSCGNCDNGLVTNNWGQVYCWKDGNEYCMEKEDICERWKPKEHE